MGAVDVGNPEFLRGLLNESSRECDFGRDLQQYVVLRKTQLLNIINARLPRPVPEGVDGNKLGLPRRERGEKKGCGRSPAETSLDNSCWTELTRNIPEDLALR